MTGAELNGSAWVLEARATVPEHVVYRSFVNETVILNLQTGRYHGVNPTGGRMLELLERRDLVGDAVQALAEEYERPPGEVARDVCAFCLDMAERGLIEMSPNGGG